MLRKHTQRDRRTPSDTNTQYLLCSLSDGEGNNTQIYNVHIVCKKAEFSSLSWHLPNCPIFCGHRKLTSDRSKISKETWKFREQNFLQAKCHYWRSTNSVEAIKAIIINHWLFRKIWTIGTLALGQTVWRAERAGLIAHVSNLQKCNFNALDILRKGTPLQRIRRAF